MPAHIQIDLFKKFIKINIWPGMKAHDYNLSTQEEEERIISSRLGLTQGHAEVPSRTQSPNKN